MAFRQAVLPECQQHFLSVAQQPQLVGHGALTFPQESGCLLLTQAAPLHQPGNTFRLLHKIQVLPLQIFHQGRQGRLPIVHPHNNAGNLRQTSQLSCPKPPLSGDKLIPLLHSAHRQRLEYPMLGNGLGQFLQSFRREHPPGLIGIGTNGTGRQKNHPTGLYVGFQLLALHLHPPR